MFDRLKNSFSNRKLDEEQQEMLLAIYVEREYLDKLEIKRGLPDLDQVNFLLRKAGLSQVNFKGSSEEQQEQLSDLIFKNISPDQVAPLLLRVYDLLNKKYKLDTIGCTSGIIDDVRDKRQAFARAIQALKNNYSDKEAEQARKKSRNQTILLCLFIVTIPFYNRIYNARLKINIEQPYYGEIFIDDNLLKSIDRVAYVPTHQDAKDGKVKRYGFVERLKRSNEYTPFKEIIFNTQGDIRKTPPVHSGFRPIFNPGGVSIIASKPQRDHLVRIFSPVRKNFNKIRELAMKEATIEGKIKFYQDSHEEKTYKGCGFWRGKRTELQLLIEEEIKSLQSFNIKTPTPITDNNEYGHLSTQKDPDEIIKNLFLGHGTSGDEWLDTTSKDVSQNNKYAIVRCIPDNSLLPDETISRLQKAKNLKIIPVGDNNSENLYEYFDECFNFIENALKNNKKVLIHCNAGASRSPTFAAAYLMRRYGLSAQEALNHVTNKRRIVNIRPGFKAQLETYEQHLKEKHQSNQPNLLLSNA